MSLEVTDGDCHHVTIEICGNAGVIRMMFRPAILPNGIVASPKDARSLVKRLSAAIKEAEEHNK